MTLQNEGHITQSIISILDAHNQIKGYGFFVDPNGMAMTCYHLIAHLPNIRIRDHQGDEYEAVVNKYFSSAQHNVAIIQIQKATPCFLYFPDYYVMFAHYTQVSLSPDKTGWIFEKMDGEDYHPHLKTENMHGLPVLIGDRLDLIGMKMHDSYPKMMMLQGKKILFGQFELIKQYLSDKYAIARREPARSQAKTICNLQLNTAINDLIDKGIYLPDQYCPRDEESKLKYAKKDPYLLVGDSGVGKTSLLAHAVSLFFWHHPVLFFSASQFELKPTGLKGEIKRLLQQTLDAHPQPDITIDDVMNLLPESNIFIDGLNEISNQFVGKFNSWIKHSIGWANSMDINLIISSTKPISNHVGVRLASFNVKQMNQAFQLYHLPEKFKTISRLSHPFIIRLIHDISSQAISAVPDDYPLMATYIARKCAAIASLTNSTASEVHHLLIELASQSENHWLSHETAHSNLIPILIQENIITQSRTGIRITNIWVYEFLISESIDPNLPWDQLSPTQRKGLPWLIAKLSFQKQDVSPIIQQLFSSITNNHPEKEKAIEIFVNTIQHLSHPDKYYKTIETFILQEQNGYLLSHDVGSLVYHSHLSFPNQLKLIKIALSTETLGSNLIHFFFSCHTSDDNQLFLAPNGTFSCKQALYRLLEIQRDKTLDIVMEWLYDYDGVSDLPMMNVMASIILHQFYGFGKKRKTHFDVRDKIFVNYKKQDNAHLAPIVKEICSLIVASLPALEPDFSNECSRQGTYFYYLRRKDNFYHYIKWLPPVVLNIIRNTTNTEHQIFGVYWLIRVPEYTAEMLQIALTLLKENKLHFRNCESLFACVDIEEYFDTIVPEMVSFIKNGENEYARKMCIEILFVFKNNEEHNLVLAQHLAALIDEVPALLGKLNQQFVAALVKVPYHSKSYPILQSLIPKLLKIEEHIWYPISLYLCREETCPHIFREKISWIRWAFSNLGMRPLCTFTILLLDTKVIKDEDQIIVLIKPVILKTLETTGQFYEAVLKKAAKKNTAVFYDIIADEELTVASNPYVLSKPQTPNNPSKT